METSYDDEKSGMSGASGFGLMNKSHCEILNIDAICTCFVTHKFELSRYERIQPEGSGLPEECRMNIYNHPHIPQSAILIHCCESA